jgi:superfamily II DNA or RNA helicase
MTYEKFLQNRLNIVNNNQVDIKFMPDYLFDFQKFLVEWSLRQTRSAIFADCGLGKTIIQLVWADNVYRITGKPVLIVAPLAVASQTIREGEKFNIEIIKSNDGTSKGNIIITNYEKLEKFNYNDFSGIVCDESSILKSFNGVRKNQITNFMKKIPYRLLATATAAPNDYIELGTSSEALGYLGHMDMLNRFFKNEHSTSSTGRMYGEAVKWRFKGYAEIFFWRWVVSWAKACRKPSDLGYNDDKFILPELNEIEHKIKPKSLNPEYLFEMPALTLDEQRREKKRTIQDRCEKVLDLVKKDEQSIIWCQLNPEGDFLEKIIPDSVQISGKDKDDKKEAVFLAFANGEIKNLITKPKIGAWGMNWQNSSNIIYFPSHSYEQYYQAVRRCWRFGQKKNVDVNIVLTEGEKNIMLNLKRKNKAAVKMFDNLVNEMNNPNIIETKTNFNKEEKIPAWL